MCWASWLKAGKEVAGDWDTEGLDILGIQTVLFAQTQALSILTWGRACVQSALSKKKWTERLADL